MNNYNYPFSAVVGQNTMKKALLLVLTNPKVGGILINGEKGCAKSTIVRSVESLVNKKIVNLPLSITEDRLIGSIDLEKTMKTGNIHFEEGILSKANKQILYVDEVNLLQDNIVDTLLDVSSSKTNLVEREGISFSHDSDYVLIGTMNKEEGELRSQFLDRFGIYIDVKTSNDPKERLEVLKKINQYEIDKDSFRTKYRSEDLKIKEKIEKAKNIIKNIELTDSNLKEIVKYCLEANIQGHRGDIIMENTSKTIAALDNRNYVTNEDIKEASELVLKHRSRNNNKENDNTEKENNDKKENNSKENNSNENKTDNNKKENNEQQNNSESK